jgi:hypothetical protein
MGWQGDCHGNGVDDPSKDGLAHQPIGVALEHFFDRGGLIAKDADTWVHRAKTLIHGGKQDTADSVQTYGSGRCSVLVLTGVFKFLLLFLWALDLVQRQ